MKKQTNPQPAPTQPIYIRLYEEFKNNIITRKWHPGTQVASIAEITKNRGVARETAKLVLSKLAGEGFIVQHRGKGSFVADLTPRKKLWALILPFYSAHYQNLTRALTREALAMGRRLLHFTDYDNPDEEIRLVGTLIHERYEAVIVVPTSAEPKTAKFYSTLSPRETFVTLLDHTLCGSAFPYTIQSYDLGVARAVKYLLEKGSGAIAFLPDSLGSGQRLIGNLMVETFLQHVRQAGREAVVVDDPAGLNPSFLRVNKISGLFCCDDADAVSAIGRLAEQGVMVPQELSVVSYGNTDLAKYFTPSLTSVDPKSEEMTATIGAIMRKRIKGETTDLCQYMVQPELIIRKT